MFTFTSHLPGYITEGLLDLYSVVMEIMSQAPVIWHFAVKAIQNRPTESSNKVFMLGSLNDQ